MERAGLSVEQVNYHPFDLDEFYDYLDITQSGFVSKAEMKNFLKKIGKMQPDKALQYKFRIPRWIKDPNHPLKIIPIDPLPLDVSESASNKDANEVNQQEVDIIVPDDNEKHHHGYA